MLVGRDDGVRARTCRPTVVVAAAALVACAVVGGGAAVKSDLAESGSAGHAGTPTAKSGLIIRAHRAAALVSLASAKAEAYWGGTRCQDIDVAYRRLDDRRIAEAEWRTSDLDPGVYDSCSITFDTTAISFSHFCATVVHEYGHLAGFHEEHGPDRGLHSANRRNVMHPVISDGNVPRTCMTGGARSR